MRVTAEEFSWRKENRVTGAYQVTEPRTFRTVKARRNAEQAHHCENCGRDTDYLFAGVMFDETKAEEMYSMPHGQLSA